MVDAPGAKKNRLTRKRSLVGAVIIILLIATGLLWYFSVYSSSPIPKQISSQLNFPLYYPTDLPNGYHVDRGTIKANDDVLLYSIKSRSGDNVVVSQQRKDNTVDIERIAKTSRPIEGERIFTTKAGKVTLVSVSDKMIAFIETDETLLIVNLAGAAPADYRELLNSLAPIKT